jgi:putative ABC transport system permease protein
LFRFDYFDEYRAFANGLVGNIILGVEEPEQSAALIRRVDALFANSPNETETSSERDYFLNFARQLGDIGLIVNSVLTAVFFTILLLTANTMSQAIRDRIPEMAILKTLGYRDWTILLLVFGESVTITVLGTVIGIVVAICLSIYISGLGANQFGPIRVTQDVVASAFMVAVLMGVIVGLQPALQAKRASIVDSLRRT